MDSCVVCSKKASSHCARCKDTKYCIHTISMDTQRCSNYRTSSCSRECQSKHWRQGHKDECCIAYNGMQYVMESKIPNSVKLPDTVSGLIKFHNISDTLPKDCLYIVEATKIGRRVSDNSIYDLDSIGQRYIRDHLDLLFVSDKSIVGKSYSVSPCKYYNSIVNILGDNIPVYNLGKNKYKQIITRGIYYGQKPSPICYTEYGISTIVNHMEDTVPFNRVYVPMKYYNYSHVIEYKVDFIRLDLLIKERYNEIYKDYDNAEQIYELKIAFDHVTSYKDIHEYVELTEKARDSLSKFDLVPILVVNGYTVYPPAFSIASTITGSIFNTTSLGRKDEINLNYDNKVIELFLRILYMNTLPEFNYYIDLLNEDIFTQLYYIADYIGIELLADYYRTLSQLTEYKALF